MIDRALPVGNAFDTLFTAASDIAYRQGSIYHVMPDDSTFWAVLTLLMASVLMMGLIRREPHGIIQIGTESVVVMLLYVLGVVLMFSSG